MYLHIHVYKERESKYFKYPSSLQRKKVRSPMHPASCLMLHMLTTKVRLLWSMSVHMSTRQFIIEEFLDIAAVPFCV